MLTKAALTDPFVPVEVGFSGGWEVLVLAQPLALKLSLVIPIPYVLSSNTEFTKLSDNLPPVSNTMYSIGHF